LLIERVNERGLEFKVKDKSTLFKAEKGCRVALCSKFMAEWPCNWELQWQREVRERGNRVTASKPTLDRGRKIAIFVHCFIEAVPHTIVMLRGGLV